MYEIKCQHCNETFFVKERRQFDGNRARKFCSLTCSAASNFIKNKDSILKTSFQKNHDFYPKGFKKSPVYNPPKLLFGKENPAYKHGKKVGRRQKFYSKIAKGNFPEYCLICHSTNHLHVHHIDTNGLNHSLNNLCILCNSCHQRLHKLMDKENRIILPFEGVEILKNRKCRFKFKSPSNKL